MTLSVHTAAGSGISVGWLLSNALAGLTRRGLKAAGADRLLATHGADVYGDTIQRWPAERGYARPLAGG